MTQVSLAAEQQHNLNAASLNEIRRELSPDSSNKLSNALFSRKKLPKVSKKKAVKQDIETIKATEFAANSVANPDVQTAHNSAGPNTDEVLDLADQLLDQLDTQDSESSTLDRRKSAVSLTSTTPGTASDDTSSIKKRGEGSFSSSKESFKSLFSSQGKKNRAQARIEKRDREFQEAQNAARRELEESGMTDNVDLERNGIARICRELQLEMVEMPPDGHCLFAAVADQINRQWYSKQPITYQETREAAADHMRRHKDDFIFFLPTADDAPEGIMSDEKFEEYCNSVKSTAEWGGQPEIIALSRYYDVPIHVYQAAAAPFKVGDQEASKKIPLRLSYHHHMYGLGEHYNSLRKKPTPPPPTVIPY